jgi:CRP-like cAMP-binding protein
MLSKLQVALDDIATLTLEEFNAINAYARVKRVRKRQFLLHEGDICRSFVWVIKGGFCLVISDSEGKDHIVDFALEREAITDYLSITRDEPSNYYIEAIEDSEVIMLDNAGFEQACMNAPQVMKKLLQKQIAQYQTRITLMVALSVEEKYQALINNRPALVKRVPQHMIASYLGVTPTTLSRLRRNRDRPQIPNRHSA